MNDSDFVTAFGRGTDVVLRMIVQGQCTDHTLSVESARQLQNDLNVAAVAAGYERSQSPAGRQMDHADAE